MTLIEGTKTFPKSEGQKPHQHSSTVSDYQKGQVREGEEWGRMTSVQKNLKVTF